MNQQTNRHPYYLKQLNITQWINRTNDTTTQTEAIRQVQPDWDKLKTEVTDCARCELCQSRTQTVFGVGNQQADLMIIGEAPGYYEDKQGEPFVGRAGQLLTNMLAAIGLKREQVYIANVLKCRPPNNRDPRPEEVAQCTPYLAKQINLVSPRLLLAVGRHAAHFLLNSNLSLARLRGRIHQYIRTDTPLIVSYHPAYLLRNPQDKAKAYEDLLTIKEYLGKTYE